jgi:hypothetical protein
MLDNLSNRMDVVRVPEKSSVNISNHATAHQAGLHVSFPHASGTNLPHKVARIPNQGQDCFIIATLRELAHLSCFHSMMTKTLVQRPGEDDRSFRVRSILQTQLRSIYEQISEGENITVEHMNDLRKSLVDIGFTPPLNKLQQILLSISKVFLRLFPWLVSSQTGDLFGLYNTLRQQLDEQDYYIPTDSLPSSDFYQSLNKMSLAENPVIHLDVQSPKDLENLNQSHIQDQLINQPCFTLKINSRLRQSGDLDSLLNVAMEKNIGKLELASIQCTQSSKWMPGAHSFIFIKRGDHWYRCNDDRISQVSFEQMKKEIENGILHICYERFLGSATEPCG